MSEYERLVELAWERYHNEPLFHARVHHAVFSVKQEAVDNGFAWPESFDGVLKAAAAVALLMPDIHDPVTGEFNEVARDSRRAERRVEQPVGLVETDPNQLNGLRSPPVDLREHTKPTDPS